MKRNGDKFKSTIPRLTINHIAAATLRTSRKAWRGVAVGIFLSLFLISAMVLSVQGVMAAQKERIAQKLGYEDCFLLDYPEMTDQQLKDSGRFDAIGRVYVTAQINGGDRYVGYYDDTAAALLNRRVMEGRMPEAAGEIALDQGMLEYLRADAGLGGKLTLDLTPIGGLPETRDFTLVGILADQSLETNMWSSEWALRVFRFPGALVSAEEPVFATGRVAIHRVMTLARGTTLHQVLADDQYEDYMFGLDNDGSVVGWFDPILALEPYLQITTLIVILLGLSLVLSACVGVAQAMEGQLSRRVEEIGMLRAVGATRRQIRRIFGRQTWLIALVLAPFSIGMGCAFAWLLSRLLPGTVLFRPSLGVIAPMLILSVACIWLSSSLPLRRASRIMPMSVIRDTQLLRKAKRIKSQTDFKPARLLAARQTRLYPTRQIGAALMAALMLFCAAIGVLGAAESTRDDGVSADYEIHNQDAYLWFSPSFSDGDATGRFLTEGDINQLRALPHMKNVVTQRQMQVNLLMDGAPDYLTASNEYLAGEDKPWSSTAWEEEAEVARARAPLVQAFLGTDKTIAQFSLKVISPPQETLNALAGYAVEGRIDVGALDAGREVLVYAPTIYQFEHSMNGGVSISRGVYKDRHDRKGQLIYTWENDAFHAGDTLDMVQLIGRETPGEANGYMGWDATSDQYRAWLERCERHDASVKIGAVLRAPEEYDKSWPLSDFGDNCFILTTEKGLKALGLYPKTMNKVEMYLDGSVDEETGDYLSERVRAIAARAEDGYVFDGVQFARTHRSELMRTTLAFAAMTLMFFAVTVVLVSGNVSRRIRADQRMIGTLRAVGADINMLTRCYGAQISVGLLAGFAAALVIVVLLITMVMHGVPASLTALSIGAMTMLAALCLLCCFLALRRSLKATMQKSIVENIREL